MFQDTERDDLFLCPFFLHLINFYTLPLIPLPENTNLVLSFLAQVLDIDEYKLLEGGLYETNYYDDGTYDYFCFICCPGRN